MQIRARRPRNGIKLMAATSVLIQVVSQHKSGAKLGIFCNGFHFSVIYRAGLDNLYTCLFMNFAKYFYWERLLPVAVDCFGYQAAYQVPFQQNMGKTSPEEAKRLAIAALLRACFHCIVKIILPHPVYFFKMHWKFFDCRNRRSLSLIQQKI